MAADIRVQQPIVSERHCRLDKMENGQVYLINLAKDFPTKVDDVIVKTSAILSHNSIITVGDRKFKFSYTHDSPFCVDQVTMLEIIHVCLTVNY